MNLNAAGKKAPSVRHDSNDRHDSESLLLATAMETVLDEITGSYSCHGIMAISRYP
jgi:hypothetical protein